MKTEPQGHTDPALPCLPHMQTQTLPSMGVLGLPHKSHSLTGTACFPQPGFCSLFFGDCFSGPGTCCLCSDSRTEKQHLGLGAGLWPADSLTRSVSEPSHPHPTSGWKSWAPPRVRLRAQSSVASHEKQFRKQMPLLLDSLSGGIFSDPLS